MKTDNHVGVLFALSRMAYMTFNEHTGRFTISVISPYNRVMYVFLTDITLNHQFKDDEYNLYLEMINTTLYTRRHKDSVNQFVLLTQSGNETDWVFKFGVKALQSKINYPTNASYFFLKEIQYVVKHNLSTPPNDIIGLSYF